MKHTNLFIALGAAFCLISCNNNTKNNNMSNENAAESVAAASEASVPDESSPIKLDFKIGDEIPAELDGFTIERQTYVGSEGEDLAKFAVKQGDELIAELHPDYDFDKDEYTNYIAVIDIISSKYIVERNLHVGSKVSDVMEAYPNGVSNDVVVILTVDGQIKLDINCYQFFVDKDYFVGQLPEVQSFEGEVIEKPEFKPDAVVNRIRFYSAN